MAGDVLTIVGPGFATSLAGYLCASTTDIARLRIVPEDGAPAHGLEPVALDLLPAAMIDPVERLVVREWASFVTVCDGVQRRHDGRVGLVDPMQIALELDFLGDRVSLALQACDGPGRVLRLADFPLRPEAVTLAAHEIAQLDLPVMAELDVGAHDEVVLQYVPQASGQVLVRRLRGPGLREGVEAAARAGDGAAIARLCAAWCPVAAVARQVAAHLAGDEPP